MDISKHKWRNAFELFVYPAMFPHLPEHLASRHVIFYACVTMVLDSNGLYYNSSPWASSRNRQLKLFWFRQIYVLSILITSTTKRGPEHTNSQYFLAWMSPFMAIFAKQWVFKTSVFVHNMTWKGIETLPDFSFKLRIDQGRKLKHIKAENICSEKLAPYSPAFDLSLSNFNFRSNNSCKNR